MSKGYLYRSLILALIVMAHYNGYTQSNTDLRFSIALEKDSYLVDEHIYLEMIVTNLASDTQFILPMTTNSSWGHMKIIFKDKFGNDVENRQGETYMAPLRGWPGLKVAPGKSWLNVQELTGSFGRTGDYAHETGFFLPAGNYSIQVIFHSNPDAFRDNKSVRTADKRTLVSKVLTFNVIEPSGNEAYEHKKLLKALARFNIEYRNPEGQIQFLRQFLNEFPNSTYLPVVSTYLLIAYDLHRGYSREKKELVEEILLRLPNHGITYSLLKMERFNEIDTLSRSPNFSNEMMQEKMKIADSTSRSSFYAKSLIEMRRSAIENQK